MFCIVVLGSYPADRLAADDIPQDGHTIHKEHTLLRLHPLGIDDVSRRSDQSGQ